MRNNHTAKPANTNNTQREFTGLPAASLLHLLISQSQKLVDVSEKETQALVQNDLLAFAILQYEKEKLTEKYVGMSEEFRARLDEFRHADKTLLNKLEKLQNALAEKSHANNAMIAQAKMRLEKSTQRTLLAAQEIAQTKLIHYDKTVQQQEG